VNQINSKLPNDQVMDERMVFIECQNSEIVSKLQIQQLQTLLNSKKEKLLDKKRSMFKLKKSKSKEEIESLIRSNNQNA
jgi:hypothetical protein